MNMGMKGNKWIVNLAIGLSLGASAQVSQAASLMEIFNLALKNDPQYQAAGANLEAAKEALPQSTANFLPSLNASASHIENTDEDIDSADSYSITLTQPIFRHNTFVQRATAKSSVAQAEADFETARQELVLAVAKAYFAVLSAEDNVEFSVAEKEANARQLDQTKQRFDVGLVAITDVHESQAAYDFSVAEAIAAENNLDSARESLREITGSYHENLDALRENMPLSAPQPASLDDWTQLALDQNSALQAAYEATEQAREFVSAQTSNHYPTLDLILNHSKYEGGTSTGGVSTDIDTEDTTATLQLNVALFEGGGTQSKIRQARDYLRASQHSLEQAKRATQAQVRNAYRGVISGISRVKALKQAVISNQSALKAAEAGYDVGTRTTVDVLDARRNLFRAQRDYAKARYDYVVESLNLKLAAGTLTSEHLNDIGTWMQ